MSNRLKNIANQRFRRTHRVRSIIRGSNDRPRLHVNISNQHVSAQVINDENGKTVAAVSTVGKKNTGKTLTEKAVWAGSEIAKKAKAKKVTTVALDRGRRIYHGRVKAFADAAREAGLEF